MNVAKLSGTSIDARTAGAIQGTVRDVPARTDPLYDLIGDPCTFVGRKNVCIRQCLMWERRHPRRTATVPFSLRRTVGRGPFRDAHTALLRNLARLATKAA